MLAGVGTLMSYRSSGPPLVPPTTNIDFLTVNDVAGLPAGSTFTRASGATRINASGALEEVAANVMRIQHDAAGVRQGLLLEEAATNVLANARDLSVWTQTGLVYTAAAAAAPNGLTEATRITEAVQTSTHFGSHAAVATVVAAGEVWTSSLFAKAETAAFVQMVLPTGNFGATAWMNFDLTAGVAGTNGGAAGLTGSIARHANGWFRLTLTGTSTAVTTQVPAIAIVQSASSARLPSYAGTGLSALIWGAQFEKNPFPTSVVLPAAGTPAASTRARDALALPPALVNFATSSLAIRYALSRWGSPGIGPVNTYTMGLGSSSAERLVINNNTDIPGVVFASAGGSATFLRPNPPAAPRDTMIGACTAWGSGSSRCSWDGAVALEDTSTGSPAATTPAFFLNTDVSGAATGGYNVFRYLRIWSGTKLTAQQVQAESGKTA